MKKVLSAIITLLIFSLPVLAESVPGEIIIKFKPNVITMPRGLDIASTTEASIKASSVAALNTKYKITKLRKLFSDKISSFTKRISSYDTSREYVFNFATSEAMDKIIEEYKKDPNVEYAQPNYIYHAYKTPNDPRYSQQWGPAKISAELAWDITTGESTSAISAVLDTGAELTHEDLASNIVAGPDYVNEDTNPADDNGHGSHVTGIIGAITNNSIGVSGINWNNKILIIKVLDRDGGGTTINVKRGLIYAADYGGIKTINLSLGQSFPDTSLKEGIDYAESKGCLTIAAAGNDGIEAPTYPAYYDNVVAVAATDQNDKRSAWTTQYSSNYGAWIDVAAPGTSIMSTWISPYKYMYDNGTSMASPFVCGVASILFSLNPSLTPAQVKALIENSADNINSLNPGYENKLGKGRINLYSAIRANITSTITSPTTGSHVYGTIPIIGSASGPSFNNYQLQLISSATTETLYASTTPVTASTLYLFNTAAKADGTYTLKLSSSSFSSPVVIDYSVSITIDNSYPTAEITSPVDGATIEGTVNIIGSARDQNLEYYKLEYSSNGADFINIASGSSSITNNLLGTWNTTNLTGNYSIKLTVKDCAGNIATSTKNISIRANGSGQISMLSTAKISPNPFNPSTQTGTFITFNLTENSNTNIYLFDIGGNLIWKRSIIAGTEGGKAGANLVPWDGKNQFGETVQNGIYLYKVTANNKVIGSGKLIVLKS